MDRIRKNEIAYHSLASVVNRVVPACSVEHVTLEILHPLESHIPGKGDSTNCGNEDSRVALEFQTGFYVAEFHSPPFFVLVPSTP